jgi:hypothetical protein
MRLPATVTVRAWDDAARLRRPVRHPQSGERGGIPRGCGNAPPSGVPAPLGILPRRWTNQAAAAPLWMTARRRAIPYGHGSSRC